MCGGIVRRRRHRTRRTRDHLRRADNEEFADGTVPYRNDQGWGSRSAPSSPTARTGGCITGMSTRTECPDPWTRPTVSPTAGSGGAHREHRPLKEQVTQGAAAHRHDRSEHEHAAGVHPIAAGDQRTVIANTIAPRYSSIGWMVSSAPRSGPRPSPVGRATSWAYRPSSSTKRPTRADTTVTTRRRRESAQTDVRRSGSSAGSSP